jgi:hypothetical protein
MKFKKIINFKCLVIILLIIIIIFMIYKNYANIESFGGSKDIDAFSIPTQKRWSFQDSNDWYRLKQNGYSIKLNQTGINVDNKNISIVFLFNNLKILKNNWRNIFHFTNTNRNCCDDGDRIPAMWIWPNSTSILVSTSTDQGYNDWGKIYEQNKIIPLGIPILISLVVKDNNTITLYINNVIHTVGYYSNIHRRNNNTILYISDPWHPQDGNTYIKNFNIYDGALTQEDINKIYDKLDQGSIGSAGQAGSDGSKGPDGKNGSKGNQGPQGLPGNSGPEGPIGPVGERGPTGPRGNNEPASAKPTSNNNNSFLPP